MNADGTNQVNLTNQAAWQRSARLVTGRHQDRLRTERDNNFEIAAMNANGTNQVNLTRTSSAGDEEPSWSPDGTKIAFTRSVLGPNVGTSERRRHSTR